MKAVPAVVRPSIVNDTGMVTVLFLLKVNELFELSVVTPVDGTLKLEDVAFDEVVGAYAPSLYTLMYVGVISNILVVEPLSPKVMSAPRAVT